MEVRINCPYCSERGKTPDRKGHLYYNVKEDVFFCFRCEAAGAGKPLGFDKNVKRTKTWTWNLPLNIEKESQLLYPMLQTTEEKRGFVAKLAYQYLLEHHINPIKASYEFDLRVSSEWLIFPVMHEKRIVFYTKRNLLRKIYMNPPVENKPLFFTTNGTEDPLVIVESYANAMRVHKWYRACALFGKEMNEAAAAEIARRSKHVIICLDEGALRQSVKMMRTLKYMYVPKVQVACIPAGDICDYSDDEAKSLIDGDVA